MDKNVTEALAMMQELSQKLAALITKEVSKETAAALPTGVECKTAFVTLEMPAAAVKDRIAAAAEKVDKPSLSPDDEAWLKMLLGTCKTQGEFTTKCKERFGWKRGVARQCYHDRKPKAAKPIVAEVAKMPPLTAEGEKQVTEYLRKVATEPKGPAVLIDWADRLPKVTTVATLDSKGKTGEEQLKILDMDAQEIYKNMGQIPAIKFIRDNTGMDLLRAKEWVDMFDDPAKPEPAELTAAKKDFLQRTAALPKSTLSGQVQATREEGIKKAMDGEKGQIVKQLKIDIAGDNKQMLVQAARRIARDLGKNGPITVDNITAEMGKTYNVVAAKGKRQNWKGSIFTKTEWVFIGNMASTQVTSHGRPVGMWALKTWLAENTVNGKETNISSFVITRLYRDFKHTYPKAELKNCNCYLGEERLAAEIRDTIVKGGNRLYEIPVTWIPASIGAVIVPPATKLMV